MTHSARVPRPQRLLRGVEHVLARDADDNEVELVRRSRRATCTRAPSPTGSPLRLTGYAAPPKSPASTLREELAADRSSARRCTDYGHGAWLEERSQRGDDADVVALVDALPVAHGRFDPKPHLDDAGVERSRRREADVLEHGEHCGVPRQHLRDERLDAALRCAHSASCSSNRVPIPLALPFVGDREGRLRRRALAQPRRPSPIATTVSPSVPPTAPMSAPRFVQSGSTSVRTNCSPVRGRPWKRRKRLEVERPSKKAPRLSTSEAAGGRSRSAHARRAARMGARPHRRPDARGDRTAPLTRRSTSTASARCSSVTRRRGTTPRSAPRSRPTSAGARCSTAIERERRRLRAHARAVRPRRRRHARRQRGQRRHGVRGRAGRVLGGARPRRRAAAHARTTSTRCARRSPSSLPRPSGARHRSRGERVLRVDRV